MKYYLMIAAKYANIRTFKAEDGTGGGAAGEGEGKGDDKRAEDDGKGAESTAKADPKAKATTDDQLTLEQALAALDAEKAEKARLLAESMQRKERLKAFEGVDPAKYRTLLEAEQAAERNEAEKKGEYERARQMMVDAHTTETSTLKEQIAELEGKLSAVNGQVDALSVGNAFGNSNFIKDKMVLSPAKTRVLYGAHFEIEGSDVVAYDKPRGTADRTKLVNGLGVALSFDEALAKIVDADPDKRDVLRARARAGAGSGTDASDGDKSKPAVADGKELYGVARIAHSLAKGA